MSREELAGRARSYIEEDAQDMAGWDRAVVQVDCTDIIGLAGATH